MNDMLTKRGTLIRTKNKRNMILTEFHIRRETFRPNDARLMTVMLIMLCLPLITSVYRCAFSRRNQN